MTWNLKGMSKLLAALWQFRTTKIAMPGKTLEKSQDQTKRLGIDTLMKELVFWEKHSLYLVMTQNQKNILNLLDYHDFKPLVKRLSIIFFYWKVN